MRFEWRISERSAERSKRWPLTLMNSARCARCAGESAARAGSAGLGPALGIGGESVEPERDGMLPEVTVFRGEMLPQDPCVSIGLGS